MSTDELGSIHYQPGQIANGHMLGLDGVWRKVPDHHEAHPPEPARGYWRLYAHSWLTTVVVTGIVVGLIGFIAMAGNTTDLSDGQVISPFDVLITSVLGGLFYGSFICFVAAAVRLLMQRSKA